MTEQTVLDIGGRTIWVAMLIASPVLLSTLATGLLVSVFQAATQINEQTLSFIPKIVVMTVVLALFGPWILEVLLHFTVEMFHGIETVTQ